MTDLGDPTPAQSSAPPAWGGTAPPPEHPELPDGVSAAPAVPRWKPWTAFVALFLGLLGATVGFVLLASVGSLFGSSVDDPPPTVSILATVVQNLCLIGAAIFFARTVARPAPWQFGLRPARWKPAIAWTVGTWVVFLAFSAVWVAIFDLADEEDTLPTELGVDESTAALLGVAFLVTVVAPLGEEIFFRGYFFRAVANWRGIWPAAILNGIVFGGIHAGGSPAAFLVPLGVFGVLLCLLYVKTQSLWPPIVLHCLNNSIAFGGTQDWDWQIPVTIVAALTVIAAFAWAVRRRFGPAPARLLPI